MREVLERGSQSSTASGDPAAPAQQAVDECGVDLTLVRYFLSLTPTERLLSVQNFMNALATVRTPPRDGAK